MRGTAKERSRRLTDISRALTYARSLEEVLDLTIECAVDIFATPRALLMLADDAGLLRVSAARGIDDSDVDRFREPLDENLLSRLSGMLGPDARERFLGVPLVVEGGVIGLLGVLRDADAANDAEEEWILSALADLASVAVDNARSRESRASLEGRVGELESDQRGKDHALEILSHDLRSPLNAIQGYASLLGSEILGEVNERQQDALRKIRRISEHLTAMLGNVLEMGRLTSGRIEVDARAFEVGTAVDEAIDIVRPAAEAAAIVIESSGPGDLRVHSDPSRMRQVLVQLLENAVKYSPDGSRVLVEHRPVHAEGSDWAEVAVVDEGPGIPEDRRARIFEPYIRHDGSAPRGHAGVGLGLAISRVLVERLGGTLRVESEIGAGSTFRIRLPAADTRDGSVDQDGSALA